MQIGSARAKCNELDVSPKGKLFNTACNTDFHTLVHRLSNVLKESESFGNKLDAFNNEACSGAINALRSLRQQLQANLSSHKSPSGFRDGHTIFSHDCSAKQAWM